jgi:hypothetical protein
MQADWLWGISESLLACVAISHYRNRSVSFRGLVSIDVARGFVGGAAGTRTPDLSPRRPLSQLSYPVSGWRRALRKSRPALVFRHRSRRRASRRLSHRSLYTRSNGPAQAVYRFSALAHARLGASRGRWSNRCRAAHSCGSSARRRTIRPASGPGLGGAGGTRTPDFLLAKEALSQLSYGPTLSDSVISEQWFAWWAMVDSNHRPRSYQDRALTG